MKRKPLNVRTHLEHLQKVLDGIDKYGLCPAIEHELAVLKLYNRAILRKHEAKRDKGQRHDVRLGISSAHH